MRVTCPKFVSRAVQRPLETFCVLIEVLTLISRCRRCNIASCAPERQQSSTAIRTRVLKARETRRERFAKAKDRIYSNAQMPTRQIRAHCELEADAERLLERAMQQQGLTAGAHGHILKVAHDCRSGGSAVDSAAFAEAIQYPTRTGASGAKSQ